MTRGAVASREVVATVKAVGASIYSQIRTAYHIVTMPFGGYYNTIQKL